MSKDEENKLYVSAKKRGAALSVAGGKQPRAGTGFLGCASEPLGTTCAESPTDIIVITPIMQIFLLTPSRYVHDGFIWVEEGLETCASHSPARRALWHEKAGLWVEE